MQQFSGSKHIKVTATSLFATHQNHAETLRENLARFCEATIKVSNPNQEMFVSAFHNGLKVGHFNESLAQKPATSMQEIIKRAECYIKGEENNAEKRSRDVRERDTINRHDKPPEFYPPRRRQPDHRGHEPPRKPYNQQFRRDVQRFPQKEYTPLNRARVYILDEILEAGLTPTTPSQRKRPHSRWKYERMVCVS
jgi:DNA mismatch repair ATPase MutS